MRRTVLLASALCFLVAGQAIAEDTFPGPQIHNQAPYNQTTMVNGQTLCPTLYTNQDLITQKSRIVPIVKACAEEIFGTFSGVSFDFGTEKKFEKCVVPDSYVRRTNGLPYWPVCCPVGRDNAKQFFCITYIVPGGK